MKYLAAYALLALSGKTDITAKDIKSVLGSIGSQTSDDEIKRCIDSLKTKPLHELIAEGNKRVGATGPAPAAVAGKKEAAKKQQPKKKEEKKPVPVAEPEEEDMDLGGLF